jgi:hypothetical protein
MSAYLGMLHSDKTEYDFYSFGAGDAVQYLTMQLLKQKEWGSFRMADLAPGVAAELLNTRLVIPGGKSIIQSAGRRFNYRAMAAEGLWNLQPTNDVTFLKMYVSHISNFCDGEDHANWAYGPHIRAPLMLAANALVLDPYSRQAIATTGNVQGTPKNSPPCLTSVQFFVRHGELGMTVNMRSNDVFLGLPLDIFQFSMWHTFMAAHLGLPLGPYVHQSASLHLYDRDVKKAQNFAKHGVTTSSLPFVGKEALNTAINQDTLAWIRHGRREGLSVIGKGRTNREDMVYNLPGLSPYADLLAGFYDLAVWTDLRQYGLSW